jgi:hypothetical protein
VPPKLQFTFSGLQGVISQKTELCIYSFLAYIVYRVSGTINNFTCLISNMSDLILGSLRKIVDVIVTI